MFERANLEQADPKFMIDVDVHRKLHPNTYPEYSPNEHEEIALSEEEPPSGNLRLLMPAKVPGFGFHDKKWSMIVPPSLGFFLN
jgi:hypothetical protein